MATEPLPLRLKAELLTALLGIDGDDYHHSLTTAQVRTGLYPVDRPPASGACCTLSLRRVLTTLGGGTMTGHVREMAYLIQAWAAPSADSADARLTQMARFEADIIRALNNARMDRDQELFSAATEFTIETQTADGQELGLSNRVAYLELLVTITARLELGEGY